MGATGKAAGARRPCGQREAGCSAQQPELVARADALIGARLAEKRRFQEHTDMSLCDEVFGVLRRSLSQGEASENSSVLLLGESGAGKTHAVEWCLEKLREVQHSLVVLRAHGGAYASDAECVRHLAGQATVQLEAAPRAGASVEQGMEWIRGALAESFKRASAVVIVLDRFEHFCSRSRQTLLYNLFDVAQEAGVRLSIIGTSEKMDVMGCLEKRIRSRFSMHHLHAFLPTTPEGLVQVLMAKLRLPPDCGLGAPFLREFHRALEAGLRAEVPQWAPELELGRPASWFLARCLPVARLLSGTAPAAKRRRLLAGSLPSATAAEARGLLLAGLAEAEHVVLLALLRLQERRATSTLSALLHEVRLLREAGGPAAAWEEEHCCAAFDRLLRLGLVELCGPPGDAAKRYVPCRSLVHSAYAGFARELQAAGPASSCNPLRELPLPVQQWAVRQ